ncbi:hypothetical protein N665_1166s0015 [Sinapis alba]|nr:hypothetical protein N665_1166s0015 [Sinapis alba]
MERTFLALSILLLFFLSFPISSESIELRPSTSLLDQEQVHEVTIKDIKREEEKSIYIFRAGKGVHGHGFKGARGGGRKAPPKRNAAMDHRPPLVFSGISIFVTGFIMLSLTSFNMLIR